MNNKIRIGLSIESNFRETDSGKFYYFQEILNHLLLLDDNKYEIVLFDFLSIENYQLGNKNVFSLGHLKKSNTLKYNILKKAPIINYFLDRFENKQNKEINSKINNLLNEACDFIYFPTPEAHFTDFPYIATVWDLGANSMPYFPTTGSLQDFNSYINKRHTYEYIYLKSEFVVCESHAGKNELMNYFGISENKIHIVPMIPSQVIKEEIKPKKPNFLTDNEEFIFYNSRFVPYKNHVSLIRAFKLFIEEFNSDIKLILCGSDEGTKNHLLRLISELELENKIIITNFVSIMELKYLYLNALGLVMPTFLGPTNMPPIEALTLGCKVAVSDLDGHREQLGNNAIYFNPYDIQEIKTAIYKLIKSEPPILHSINQLNTEIFKKLFDQTFCVVNNWK